MDSELEDIRRRLSLLERQETVQQPLIKTEKKKNEYQQHMSNRLRELKEEAGRNDVQFDRKQAFGQAAREWTAKKNK